MPSGDQRQGGRLYVHHPKDLYLSLVYQAPAKLHRTEEAIAGRRGFEKRAVVADVVPKRWQEQKREGDTLMRKRRRLPRLTRILCSSHLSWQMLLQQGKAEASYGGSPRHQTRPNQAGHALWGCAQSSLTCRHFCLGI